VMNSGVWGQCDSIYATFCAASLVSLVRGRPWAASAWFGVAFAFKLQAIFLLPVLVGVLLVSRRSGRCGARWRDTRRSRHARRAPRRSRRTTGRNA